MKKKNQKKTRYVQIVISEKCNLKCIYCYEKAKDLRLLSEDKIKAIVKDTFENSDGFEAIEFNFHGGEVALFFDEIKNICEWIWAQIWEKPYICCACSNGTLIHGKIQDWFEKNRHRFYLGLSLDGTKEMHNTNRCNSYDQIDFAFFHRCWPDQGVKMTISPQTLPTLSDGLKHIVSLGFPYAANLAYGVDWPDELLDIYQRELLKAAHFYLDNPELELPNLLDFPIRQVGLLQMFPERAKERYKWCGSGEGMICYGCDGEIYPCQVFMPSAVSQAKSLEAQSNVWKSFDFFKENVDDPDCAECVLHGGCPVCYGHNFLATGTLWKRPKDICKFRKIEALATSYLYGKMLQDYTKYLATRTLPDIDRLVIAKGILTVQKTFCQ